jgi:small redox-active disulfide protein 2
MPHVKILGVGCPKCRQLHARVAEAAEQLGAELEIEKVTELDRIMQHGVMLTPGLVIDDRVRSAGRVPSVEQIKSMLRGGAEER